MNRDRLYLLAGLVLLAAVALGSRQHPWAGALRLMPPPSPEEELARTRDQLQRATSLLEDCFGGKIDLENIRSVPVTISAYSSTPEQCDDSPHITASSSSVRVGIIAVSSDLFEELELSYGQRVLIPGYGLFEVHDRMHPRWKRKVDIWESDTEAARRFGRQQGVLIWALPPQQEARNGVVPPGGGAVSG
jgi:3D (Asp-Asp-Asp) domain-containing protein